MVQVEWECKDSERCDKGGEGNGKLKKKKKKMLEHISELKII